MIIAVLIGLLGLSLTILNFKVGIFFIVANLSISWPVVNNAFSLGALSLPAQKLSLIIMSLGMFTRKFDSKALLIPVVFCISYAVAVSMNFTVLLYWKSLISRIFPWLLTGILLSRRNAIFLLKIVAILPIFAVIFGFLLSTVSSRNMLMLEYSGVFRLQAFLVSSHLAFLCFWALVSVCLMRKLSILKSDFLIFMNFMLLIGTASRAGMLAAIIVLIGYYWSDCVRFLKLRISKKFVWILCFSCILLVAIVAIIIQRNLAEVGAEYVMSGRLSAWIFFIEGIAESPYIGHGIGAAQFANASGTVHKGFVAPHNEYIGMVYEMGIIGFGILLIAGYVVHHIRRHKYMGYLSRPLRNSIAISFLFYSIFDNTLGTPQSVYPMMFIIMALFSYTCRQL